MLADMKAIITTEEINKAVKFALKHIRQANKDLPYKVRIDRNLRFFPHETYLTVQIPYVDGDGRQQYYNIAM